MTSGRSGVGSPKLSFSGTARTTPHTARPAAIVLRDSAGPMADEA
ncbi:hypothetical protein [Nonomuraea jabiensis]